MTYRAVNLHGAYQAGIISSCEYVNMAEWLANAEDRDDPNEMDLVNLMHALEQGILSPDEYVEMADFLFAWLVVRLEASGRDTARTGDAVSGERSVRL